MGLKMWKLRPFSWSRFISRVTYLFFYQGSSNLTNAEEKEEEEASLPFTMSYYCFGRSPVASKLTTESSMVSSSDLNFHPSFSNFSELIRSTFSFTCFSFLSLKLPLHTFDQIRPEISAFVKLNHRLDYLLGKLRLGYIFISFFIRSLLWSEWELHMYLPFASWFSYTNKRASATSRTSTR